VNALPKAAFDSRQGRTTMTDECVSRQVNGNPVVPVGQRLTKADSSPACRRIYRIGTAQRLFEKHAGRRVHIHPHHRSSSKTPSPRGPEPTRYQRPPRRLTLPVTRLPRNGRKPLLARPAII